jgi:hypothetical protein
MQGKGNMDMVQLCELGRFSEKPGDLRGPIDDGLRNQAAFAVQDHP